MDVGLTRGPCMLLTGAPPASELKGRGGAAPRAADDIGALKPPAHTQKTPKNAEVKAVAPKKTHPASSTTAKTTTRGGKASRRDLLPTISPGARSCKEVCHSAQDG